MKSRTSSISPASKNAPARCGPPSSSRSLDLAAPELVERGVEPRRLVLAGGDDDLGAGALAAPSRRAEAASRRATTTISGASGDRVDQRCESSGRRAGESKTTRRGWRGIAVDAGR